MATINITLNQEEIQHLLLKDSSGAFRELLERTVNAFIQAESDEQLGAERYAHNVETRTDFRNGNRFRNLVTRIGTITLCIPRHRNVPFKSMLLQEYKRGEAALISVMAEMVVNGVSTRKISVVMEQLCGTSFSKSTVSDACKELDAAVKEFKERPLTKEYPFVMVDATYFKVRENHRIVSKAYMVALGTDSEGNREILGCEPYDNESKETWKKFLEMLKNRGLHGVRMFTSDSHEGILYGICKTFPTVPWQRCQTHFSRNVIEKAPPKYQKALHAALLDMYNCDTLEEARRIRDEIIAEYKDVAEKAMECLDAGFEDAMTVMAIPKSIRKYFRTTNHLERLNRELKRRSRVIGVFPNEASLDRLMGSVLLETNDRMQTAKRVPAKKSDFDSVKECAKALQEIAAEQAKTIAA